MTDDFPSPPLLYPREVVCGGCGESLMISWRPRYEPNSDIPVYVHPDRGGCWFIGKILRPTGIGAYAVQEEDK